MKQLIIIILYTAFFCSACRTEQKIITAKKDNTGIINITAVGDLVLGGVYVPSRKKHITWLIDIFRKIEKEQGKQAMYDHPFKNVKHIFAGSDIALCNWECVSSSNIPYKRTGKKYFVMAPPDFANCASGVFDIAILANNHSMDYNVKGLKHTLHALKQAGIRTIGAGINLSRARQPVILERKGVKIAFLGYTPLGTFADETSAGVAGSPSYRELKKMVLEDIDLLKKKADIIIINFHWGEEYKKYPNAAQKDLARAVIDHGALAVIGHHSHNVQGIEKYKNGLICYSLGNFVFGASTGIVKKSFIIKIKMAPGKVIDYEIFPININPSSTSYSAVLLKGREKEEYLKYLKKLGKPE